MMNFVNIAGITLVILSIACFLRTRDDNIKPSSPFNGIGVALFLGGVALIAIASS